MGNIFITCPVLLVFPEDYSAQPIVLSSKDILAGRHHRVTGKISGHFLHQLWYHCVLGVAGEERFMCIWEDTKRIWSVSLEDAEVSVGRVHHWNDPSFS